jgi:hypothetical protein
MQNYTARLENEKGCIDKVKVPGYVERPQGYTSNLPQMRRKITFSGPEAIGFQGIAKRLSELKIGQVPSEHGLETVQCRLTGLELLEYTGVHWNTHDDLSVPSILWPPASAGTSVGPNSTMLRRT